MIPVLISLFSAVISFRKPICGFAIFLLFNTGAVGFFQEIGILSEKLGPLQPGNIACVVAVVVLFMKKSSNENVLQHQSAIKIIIWVFTVLILFSRLVELEGQSKIIWEVIYSFLWAPLFMAFLKLNPSQRYLCKKLIIFMSALTAFFTVLIVVTGSSYLYDTLSIRADELAIRQFGFTTARVTIPGVWTVMPFGFWFCMRELFTQQRRSWRGTMLYGSALGLMFIAVLLNLTRSLLLGMGFSFLFVIISTAFFLPRQKKVRLIVLSVLLIVGLWTTGLIEGLQYAWKSRFMELQLGGSATARVERSKFMLNFLSHDLSLLGHKDLSVDQYYPFVGDPHTFITVWWNYGLIASLAFVALIIVVFVKLARILMLRKYYPEEVLTGAIFLMAVYFQFHWMMASGDYLFEGTVFPLIFFMAEVAQLSRGAFTKGWSGAAMYTELKGRGGIPRYGQGYGHRDIPREKIGAK